MISAPNKLRVLVRPTAIRIQRKPYDPETKNQGARLLRLREWATALVRYERMELAYHSGTELQAYTECLLQEALKYGPRHKPTMELLDFWMLEKDLVHKMFKVLVPRFEKYEPPYTKYNFIPPRTPGIFNKKRIVLELKGNPYPPVEPRVLEKQHSLANILLSEAKREYSRQQHRRLADLAESTSPVITSEV